MTHIGINWAELSQHYDHTLVQFIRDRFNEGGRISLTTSYVASSVGCSEGEARIFLKKLEQLGELEFRIRYDCPCCRRENLGIPPPDDGICPFCDCAFIDFDSGLPIKVEEFVRDTSPTRDTRWIFLLHGMNSRGDWQQEFNWLIAQQYGYSVPVYICKYGLVRLGAILPPLQRAKCRRVASIIRAKQELMVARGLGERPDVFAHSFGTWLIAHALRDDPDLRIGRLVLLGSIVRPDFDWRRIFAREQVEAVLCHMALADLPVALTHYFIPDSGPSGRQGFNERQLVAHHKEVGFGHSDYFKVDRMDGIIKHIWGPFLTEAPNSPKPNHAPDDAESWTPKPWPIHASILPWVIAAVIVVIALFVLVSLTTGIVVNIKRFV